MDYRGVLGHEFVGEVVETTNRDLSGRRVVGEINAACGRCDLCQRGLGRHCRSRSVLGILGRDGCFADYLSLPDDNLLLVPDSMPDDIAVFTEPVAAAFQILEQNQIARNESIAILGDGRLGAIVAMALNTEHYVPVMGGHHKGKLARLADLGITTSREADLKPGFDVVIDCAGSASGFARAMELVRPRGRIVLKSTMASAPNLSLASIVINEISVIGSRCGRFAPALAALEAGKLDVRALISSTYALEDGVTEMDAAAGPSNFKVLLNVS
jgi:threonine dehydrogenase-like Zn-dependent dehydrogenase